MLLNQTFVPLVCDSEERHVAPKCYKEKSMSQVVAWIYVYGSLHRSISRLVPDSDTAFISILFSFGTIYNIFS